MVGGKGCEKSRIDWNNTEIDLIYFFKSLNIIALIFIESSRINTSVTDELYFGDHLNISSQVAVK